MPAAENTVGATYRVLARKYRPTTFDQLSGQDAMVRTLTNAFASGRIARPYAHGACAASAKTTTARIIARALNCVGPDGKGGPTAMPCGQCDTRAIAEDRHVDVIEWMRRAAPAASMGPRARERVRPARERSATRFTSSTKST